MAALGHEPKVSLGANLLGITPDNDIDSSREDFSVGLKGDSSSLVQYGGGRSLSIADRA
jgi:hypothetical protein